MEHEQAGAPYVTVVLPCYNEQDHVGLEVERICAAVGGSPHTYELAALDGRSTGAAKPVHDQVEPFRPASSTVLILLTSLIIGSIALLVEPIVRSRAP